MPAVSLPTDIAAIFAAFSCLPFRQMLSLSADIFASFHFLSLIFSSCRFHAIDFAAFLLSLR